MLVATVCREVWSANAEIKERIIMKKPAARIVRKLHPKNVLAFSETFLKDEYIGSKLILGAALLSLIVVNSPWQATYTDFWHQTLRVGLGPWGISLDLRHWINEGLMAFFFLTVGLEIKREFVKGALGSSKTAILPIGAAIGGMIFPALIYLIFNLNSDAVNGWGIPIATDIAFAVAVLMMLG
ncbi:Na+/H+ antiporter NhaA, partial [Candidatus Saccharibacteria bacterium]|nr:Na+/H+ antiporter NhaA [Candidatus Saccharibacteria bacterium]